MIDGVVLAAGAGRRMGQPKALVIDDEGSWLARAVHLLRAAGCRNVSVVLGAEAARAAELAPAGTSIITVDDWHDGLSASLRAAVDAAATGDADALLIHLVDLPDVTDLVVRRVLRCGDAPDVLARAVFGGRPGHPVLIGRDHWGGVRSAATGDAGARDYLRAHRPVAVECGDLASGADVDHPRPDIS